MSSDLMIWVCAGVCAHVGYYNPHSASNVSTREDGLWGTSPLLVKLGNNSGYNSLDGVLPFSHHLKDNYHSFFHRIVEKTCLYLELRTLLNPYWLPYWVHVSWRRHSVSFRWASALTIPSRSSLWCFLGFWRLADWIKWSVKVARVKFWTD